jgi:hypothetical protein
MATPTLYFLLAVLLTTACEAPTGDDDNPLLSVEPRTLDYGEDRESLTLTIANMGSGSLNWELIIPASERAWIKPEMTVGNMTTEPAVFSITIHRDQATPGEKVVQLTVASPGTTATVELRASIPVLQIPAALAVSSISLDFGETGSVQQFEVRNTGGTSLDWEGQSGQTWISFTPNSGTVSPGDRQAVNVKVSREDLSAGEQLGAVDVTSNGGSATVSVRASVPERSLLTVSPQSIDFGSGLQSQTIEIRNSGSAVAQWAVESSDAWVSVAPASGSVLVGETRSVTVLVDRSSLAVGTHQGRLTFQGDDNEVTIDVFVTVVPLPVLELSTSLVETGTEASASFRIVNSGTGTLVWNVSASADWLNVEPHEGTSLAIPKIVTLSIDRMDQLAGTHSTVVTVVSDGGTAEVEVSMVVPSPRVSIDSGPIAGEVTLVDSVTWKFGALDAFSSPEFSARVDGGDWSTGPIYGVGALDESSTFGSHTLEARVRTLAGQSEIVSEDFVIDAVSGPAVRLMPHRFAVSRDQIAEMFVVLEEVTDVLGGNILVVFEPAVDLQDAVLLVDGGSFLGQQGAEILAPEIDARNERVKFGFAAPGVDGGIRGSGAIAKIRFIARSETEITLDLSRTVLRDLANDDLPIRVRGAEVIVP